MNILLIKTVLNFNYSSKTPPLGLLYIASFLRKNVSDINIKIHDQAIKRELKEKFLKEFNPEIIGISSLTLELNEMIKLAEICKKILPNSKIVVGGPCAFEYKKILDTKLVDFVFIGEGEISFTEFVKNFNDLDYCSKISGISFYYKNKLIVNQPEIIEDIDILPYPAYDLIEIPFYSTLHTMTEPLKKGSYYLPVFTSRGCPYQCIYCHKIFGKKVRLRSADSVYKEIKLLVNNYGINEIHIFDDIFNIDKNRLLKICGLIEKFNLKIAFPNGLRTDILDNEQILALKKAGTYHICIAVESGSEKIQKILKKHLNLEKVKQNIEFISKQNIFTVGFVMIGFPFETLKDIKMTSDYLAETKLNSAFFFQVTPYPGTKLYDICNNKKELKNNEAFFLGELYHNSVNSVSKINIHILNLIILLIRLRFYNIKRIISIIKVKNDIKWVIFSILENILSIFKFIYKIIF